MFQGLGSGIMLALNTIREHKMRAFLTVLGVIIGTGTIIGVGSIIAGLDGAISGIFKSFGPNTVIVFKFPIGFAGGKRTPEEIQRKRRLMKALVDKDPEVETIGAVRRGVALLTQLGTPEAVRLLETLVAREGDVGALAARALKRLQIAQP